MMNRKGTIPQAGKISVEHVKYGILAALVSFLLSMPLWLPNVFPVSYVSPTNECAAETCYMKAGCYLYIDETCLMEKRLKNLELESSPKSE